jgi:hypothetical protein
MRVCALIRKFACLIMAGVFAISAAPSDLTQAGDAPQTYAAGTKCDLNQTKEFERRPAFPHWIVAKFVIKPKATADTDELRKFFTYLHILGKFSAKKLYTQSLERCSFGYGVDAFANLEFELYDIGQHVRDECSLSRCVSSLSNLIASSTISQDEFSQTVTDLIRTIRRSELITFKYPGLAANNALREVYRHIYLPGTRERVMLDIDSNDFLRARFEDFNEWFETQQVSLRNGDTVEPKPFSSSSQTADGVSPSASHVDVEELKLDHHGWGHKSIILIDQAYESEGIAGIENATLRALCHSHEKGVELDREPWREMAGRLSCHRDRVGQDRWLGLYSRAEPRATGEEMMRYAQAIAEVLKGDRRARPGLRIVVATFLQQK